MNTTNLNQLIEDEDNECLYLAPVYLNERFWLVTIIGTTITICSVVENIFLFFMLVRK